MQPTVLSLFCGAGGFDLGFKQAGYRIVGAYDFDKYAIQSYRAHLGDHGQLADVRELRGTDLPVADVWTYGFPCQDLSVAGPKAGLFDGKKSKMFFEVMRLLGEVPDKPQVILAENVKGLRPYLEVLRDEYDRAGYRMIHTMYNSKHFGVPQSRERYFVLGVRKDLDRPFVFHRSDKPLGSMLSILEENVADRYFYSDDKVRSVLDGSSRSSSNLEGILVIGRADGINGHDILKRVYDPVGLSPTLDTCEGGNRQPKILLNGRVRKLTPREYMRLQGFPDSFDMVCSGSQVYKQMGNAVTVPVARFIASSIHEQLLK